MQIHIEFNQNYKTELLNQIISESVLMKALNSTRFMELKLSPAASSHSDL